MHEVYLPSINVRYFLCDECATNMTKALQNCESVSQPWETKEDHWYIDSKGTVREKGE